MSQQKSWGVYLIGMSIFMLVVSPVPLGVIPLVAIALGILCLVLPD